MFQLPPGEFNSLPEDLQTVLLDNARVVPLMFAAPPPPAITCDMLKDFTRPTLVMRGEKTREFWGAAQQSDRQVRAGGSGGRSSKCQP